MKFVDILLNLSKPEKLFLSTYNLSKERELAEDLDIDLGRRSSGWPVFPDILINPNSREFVGLTYYVSEKYSTFAQQFDYYFNNQIVRYLKNTDIADLPYYAQQEHSDYLEVIWSYSPIYQRMDAQLICDRWVLKRQSDIVAALHLNKFYDEINGIEDFDLVLPKSFLMQHVILDR